MAKTIKLELSLDQINGLFMAVVTAGAIRNAQIEGKVNTWFHRPLNIPGLEKQRLECYKLEELLRPYLP